MNLYKFVSFKLVIILIYRKCYIVIIKFISLSYLKIDEFKVFDCWLKVISVFYCKIKLYIRFKMLI